MKEPGNEFSGTKQPEVAAILEAALTENGERMFKIAWKTTWVHERNLTCYKNMIDEFCTNCHERNNRLHKVMDKQDYIVDERIHNEREMKMRNYSLYHTQSKIYYPERSRTDLKRKTQFNLENIVSKLKKTRTEENDCEKSVHKSLEIDFHHHTENDNAEFEQKREKENKEPYCINSRRLLHMPHEIVDSPSGSSDDSEEDVDIENVDEKSSFLAELEQKDDQSYMNTLSMTSKPEKRKHLDGSVEVGHTEKQGSILKPTDSIQLRTLLAEREKVGSFDSDNDDRIKETKCEKCNKKFYRRSQLIRHLSNHVIHECHRCNAVFYCVRRYKRHVATHETYPCDYCNEEFYDASAWYQHRAKHTMIECSSCEMVFYSRAALLKHKAFHMQYICPICQSTFPDLSYWLPHRAFHGKYYGNQVLTPIIKCRECHAGFAAQESFTKHVCLFGKKSRDKKRSQFTKMEISDLIGIDQTGIRM